MKLNHFFLAIVLLFNLPALSQQKLTLEEAVSGQFRQFAPKSLSQLNWIPGTDDYAYVKDNVVMMGKLKAKAVDTPLFSLEDLNSWSGTTPMKAMPQLTWLSKETCYFQNENAFLEVNLKSKKIEKKQSFDETMQNMDYDARTGQLAYTIDNNLFVSAIGGSTKVTEELPEIVSGQSVSRNEYGINKGTFWSPDHNKLAFYQKNESMVTNYPLVNYTEIPAKVKEIKYPMAGGGSEVISVGVFDLSTKKTNYLQLSLGLAKDDFYATNLSWSPDSKTIYIAWLNRATTDMEFRAYEAETGARIKKVFVEHDDKWLEPMFPAVFIPNQPNKFLWTSQRDGFTNLYLYNTSGLLLGNTKAKFEITELVGFDSKGENAFVMATGEFPTESLCYKVSLKDMSMTKVSQINGTHQIKISGTGAYIIDQYSNLTTPNKIDVLSADGRLVKNLLTAPNPYEGKSIGKTEIFAIKANDGSDLWCRTIKPSDFDPSKKYPVLVYVYGGPHAQMITNSFSGGASLWMNQLAEEGFIIFTLDNHGSANRGKAFEQVIHRNLGVQELSDQMLGVDWLKKQTYVDSKRMAVHGWSFGGFMTTSLMLKYPDVFKVGVAGGPVIDWAMYEVMYGERYMDTPQENPDGYKNADLTQFTKNLRGKLLMIHGADDNVVVMQHNMRFLKSCVDNKVQVDFFTYPGHEHNVRGKDRVHLMTKVIEYIKENL